MLRSLVLGLGVVMTVVGVGATAMGVPLVALIVFGPLLVIGTLFERVAYKRIVAGPPAPNFRPTPERFIDDATGAAVTVWTDPSTGERKYVRD